jgi:hypothetical protein
MATYKTKIIGRFHLSEQSLILPKRTTSWEQKVTEEDSIWQEEITFADCF